MTHLASAVTVTALLAIAPASAAGASVAVPTACAGSAPEGYAHCDSEVLVSQATHAPVQPAAQLGFGPTDLQSAYRLTSLAATQGSDQKVAVVDAYDNPKAESDLAVYRSSYGLPACTTANGCFTKVNQSGGSTPPLPNAGWAAEISLDLDMVSAVCPRCKILLVEANSNSFNNLATAVNRAATLGATQITNSYGGSEFGSPSLAASYAHPGVAITASSGDDTYTAGPEAPAAFASVTAVGGTSLCRAGSALCLGSTPRGWTESVWTGAGSGCSAFVAKPSWQHDTGCAKRSIADVAAVADPATGVAVYDSYPTGGWAVYGGTSASAPIIAGFYALIGSGVGGNGASWAYANAGRFFDVTAGANGVCSLSYLCTGGVGYDGPTGLGTPNGSLPNAAPTAAITASPNPVVAGQTVTFDAGGSSDADGTIVRFEWDLDGNGSYETNTGAVPTVTRIYPTAGQVAVGVQVTDDAGATATAARTLEVTIAPAQTGGGGTGGGSTGGGSTGGGSTGGGSTGGGSTGGGSTGGGSTGGGSTDGGSNSSSTDPTASVPASGGGSTAGSGTGSGSSGGTGASAGGSGAAGVAAAQPVLTLGSSAVTVDRLGRAHLPARCEGPAGSACNVTFTVRSVAGVAKGGRRVATRQIGSGGGSVPAGGNVPLALTLTRTGRVLLERTGRLRVTVAGALAAAGGPVPFSTPARLKLKRGR